MNSSSAFSPGSSVRFDRNACTQVQLSTGFARERADEEVLMKWKV